MHSNTKKKVFIPFRPEFHCKSSFPLSLSPSLLPLQAITIPFHTILQVCLYHHMKRDLFPFFLRGGGPPHSKDSSNNNNLVSPKHFNALKISKQMKKKKKKKKEYKKPPIYKKICDKRKNKNKIK